MEIVIPEKLFVIKNLLDKQQTLFFIKYIDDLEMKFGNKQQTDRQQKFRYQVQDQNISKKLWDILLNWVDNDKYPRCSNRVPLIRYNSNAQSILRHKDPKFNDKEHFGVIIYLNDGFKGGETIFYNSQHMSVLKHKPKKGYCIIFDMDMWHNALGVSNGQKYIICPRIEKI